MESKLLESIINEDKLKKEIELLKKENNNYKIQLSHNFDKNENINSNGLNVNENSQINNSNHLLHKLTHSTFHSSTFKNLIYEGSRPKESYNSSEKNDLYYNQGMENEVNYRKRNNSDNNKNIINHSFKKFENFGKKGMKLLFKYCKNNKENINNINNSAMPSFHQNIPKYQQLNNSNYLNKNKKALYIKLNKGLDNSNPTINSSNYLTTINYQGINKPINYDFGEIKQIKTEYNINNIEEYKKGNLYEYNSNILYTDTKGNSGKSKDFKVQFCCKSKDKKENPFSGKENIIIKKNKEKLNCSSSKQIQTIIGKNLNERKKKQKINI